MRLSIVLIVILGAGIGWLWWSKQPIRRKAGVVTAVRIGRITLEEALQRYQVTEEEYRSWERAFEQHGPAGLRSTRV